MRDLEIRQGLLRLHAFRSDLRRAAIQPRLASALRAAVLVACMACGSAATEHAGDGGPAAQPDAASASDAAPDRDARDGAGGSAADCEPIVDDILLTCGNIVCHDPFSGGIGTQLDLSDRGALPESLLGQRSSDACGNRLYIDPAQPAQSLLLLKLEDNPPCGERMPAGDRPALTAMERACFAEWVTAAAQRASGGS